MVLKLARGEENFLNNIKADNGLRKIVRAARAQIIYSQSDPRSQEERQRESKEARRRVFDYGLYANYGRSNEEAADELAQVMNYVHGIFVPRNEPFRATILYRNDRGKYVSRE